VRLPRVLPQSTVDIGGPEDLAEFTWEQYIECAIAHRLSLRLVAYVAAGRQKRARYPVHPARGR